MLVDLSTSCMKYAEAIKVILIEVFRKCVKGFENASCERALFFIGNNQ